MQTYDQIHVDAIKRILNEGIWKKDRTHIGENKAVFGHAFHFSMSDGVTDTMYVPFMQCRRFAPRIAFEELMWMLRGHTDSKILEEKNIGIWKGNTSREFLDSKGLEYLEEGDIGRGYGYQMRNFNGIDQLKRSYDILKNDPTNRKNVISLWNASDLENMALEPCHFAYTFMVQGEYLNLHQQQRSQDLILGGPYNAAFTSLWLAMFSKALGYKPGSIFCTITDMHIYKNLIDIAETLTQEDASQYSIPSITINKDLNSLEDILDMEYNDLSIIDWEKGPKIGNPEMAK